MVPIRGLIGSNFQSQIAYKTGRPPTAKNVRFRGQSRHPNSTASCPLMTDAVEKGRGMPPARNYRISGDDILNRSCAFHAGLESILLGDPSQNPFSTASTHSGHRAYGRIVNVMAVTELYRNAVGLM